MMKEEPVDVEKPRQPAEQAPVKDEDVLPQSEDTPPMLHTNRKRIYLLSGFLILLLCVILAVVLPLTLQNDNDNNDSSSNSEDNDHRRNDAFPTIPNVFTDEANNLNYKDTSEFETDLTSALLEHVQFFIKERQVPFRCWYPMSNETVALEEGEALGGADDGSSYDKGEDIGGVTDFGTNVQEASVDEADTMKADANYVYASVRDHILVWDREGNQAMDLRIIGEEGEYRRIKALLITDEYLVVIVDAVDNWAHENENTKIVNQFLSTHVRLYLKDKSTGELTFAASKKLHGTYVNARSIGDSIYVQTQSCLNVAERLLDYLPGRLANEDFLGYSQRLTTRAKEFLIPVFLSKLREELESASGDLPTLLKLSPWDHAQGEISFLSYLTQVTSFSVDEPGWDENNELTVSASAILGQTSFPYLYASGNNFVLASTSWSHEPYYTGNLTHLVAMEVDSQSSRFLSVGTLEGELLNQYALDILGNDLRAATTVDRGWVDWDSDESRTVNYMTVLNIATDVEGQMAETGRVQIGKPNERIMSVRFFDNIAYAVTFEQTDPFYVLDMLEPEVLGELSLPGFSSYLHSMNEENSLLVAVGEGGDRGLVVTVFDSTDPANPKPLVQNQFRRGATSSSRWDYKAFRFIRSLGKLIIPLDVRSHYGSKEQFEGFVVLDVSTSGVTESHRISHRKAPGTCGPCFHFDGQRSFVYSGELMTVKNSIVVSTDLDDGDELWRLHLELEGDTSYCCW